MIVRSAFTAAVFILGISIVTGAQRAAPPASSRTILSTRVKAEFQHAWDGYKQYAWGHDELNPISQTSHDWYGKTTFYMTAVDALDTLILMGMREEADKTREFLDIYLKFDVDASVSVFEVTIRLLGGLLSNYQLTKDSRLLEKAVDLANRLLPAFKSKTGMPYRFVNLKTGAVSDPESNPAEIGTLILEFGALSRLTSDMKYLDTAKKALLELHNRRSRIALVGDGLNVETGKWTSKASHVGGGIDSYYEYLLKCNKLLGIRECGAMWRTSMEAVHKYVADDDGHSLWYGTVDMDTGARMATTFGALHAFFPAALALSGDLTRAKRLQDSAFRMWTANGIEPDELNYRTMKVTDPAYPLRPEIVESAYYLYHYTNDAKYLTMGQRMFDDVVKFCRTPSGYTVLTNVVTKKQGDRMPSYALAETFKYFYLLAQPDAIEFDRVVFNTEGHPLRRTW
jgi:glycosyl hydrolase family 47